MVFLKDVLRKLFTGFLYGVGFTLGVWVIAVFVAGKVNLPEKSVDTVAGDKQVVTERKEKSAEIISSKAITRPYLIDVIGTLKNNGTRPLQHTEVVADLFGKNGEFIYQCKTWISETIPVGAQANFKVSCHGITEEIYQGYSSYTLKVSR